jgi:hypothetical protein
MTLAPTWERNLKGPAMHALVIGVAGYPTAKKGQGYDAFLRGVEDVQCAVASARRMADWLFDNKDTLTPRLASIDLLLSDAPADPARSPYPMRLQPQAAIEEATGANVKKHGEAWQDRFKDGDSAFFFISGHGAMSDDDAVVFLSDLNSDRTDPWGAYLNITETARALKGDQRLTAAFFFSDACQEYSPRFAQVKHGDGVHIVIPQDPLLLGNARDKVAFITAASQGLETLEGDWDGDARVKMGRFTQVLLKALDGGSARQLNGDWVVYAESIVADLKSFYRLRNWTDLFEPSPVLGQNERFSIIQHRQPKVPVILMTRPPDRLPDCSLEIFLPHDRSQPAIQRCDPGPRKMWEVWLAASIWPHLIVATHPGTKSDALAIITPHQPIFGQTLAFP